MRILKHLSFLVCLLMLATQAHAMLRACMGALGVVEQALVRNSHMLVAPGGVNPLNGLTLGQQPPLAGGPLGVFQPVQYYSVVVGGGSAPEVSEDEERDGDGMDDIIEELIIRDESRQQGFPPFYERLLAGGVEEEALVADEDEALQGVQEAIDAVFRDRDIGGAIEGVRALVLLERGLLNIVNHVELARLVETPLEDSAQDFVAQAMRRYFQQDTIGYSLFDQALKNFEKDPAQFLVNLEDSDSREA